MPPTPQQRSQIKAVFFDLDDTLLPTTESDTAALRGVAAVLAESRPEVEWDDVHAAWRAAFTKAPWDKEHQVPVEEWRARHWREALRGCGAEDDELGTRLQAHFTERRTAGFRMEARVQELVRQIRARGLQAVIITNGHPEVQRSKLAACDAGSSFEHVLVGGEEVAAGRAEKPAASIFRAACTLAGCEPHEAVHIGDSLGADIQGGINAGLAATVWVNPQDLPLPPAAPQPTYVVQHVTELLRVLDELVPAGGGAPDGVAVS